LSDISFTQDGKAIYIVVNCHAECPIYEESELLKAHADSTFYKTYVKKELLLGILESINDTVAEIKNGAANPSEYRHEFAEVKDAVVSIKVANDKMSAKAQVEMPWGGKIASVDTIKKECKYKGLSFGLKRSKVEALLENSFDARPGEIFEAVIAVGKDPKHGKNAYFKPLVELFSEKIRKPTEMEGGKVDLKDLGDIETVKPGERIFQKIPLTVGIDGRNVLGEVIPATPGKDAKLEVSSGTTVDPSDHNVLLANKEGLARLIDNRMEVDDVYTLVELTPKQGHVKFNGSVIVLGDVSPEMKIIASGDVLIAGFVESASIRCRGELTVLSGVSGKALDEPFDDRKNNCLLESGNRVNVSFANHVDIVTKRDVFVHKQISHCNVVAASIVVGKGQVPRGKIIGGHYFISKYIEVGHLGAPSDTVTHISMNRTYDVFKQKEKHFWDQVEQLQLKLEKWHVKLSSLVKEDQKVAVKFEIAQLENIINKNINYRKTLIQRRREYMENVVIKVNHSLYGGLNFRFGSKVITNEARKGPSIVRLDEYQLVIEPKN
jgi:uncharacterized protein (DUF342 family)